MPTQAENLKARGYKLVDKLPEGERRQSVYRQAHSMTEAELKALILPMAKSKGWIVHTTPQIKPLRPARRDGSSGYPDLTLARDGEVLWLELKAEDGKLSAEQIDWQLALPRMEVIRPSDLARGRVDELLA